MGAFFFLSSYQNRYLLSARSDCDIDVFEKVTLEQAYHGQPTVRMQKLSVLHGHTSPVRCIQANPKYDVVATACNNIVLWIRSNSSSSQQ